MSSSSESNTNGEQPKPVKLPYFHRTLSPQDAALVGDITPKQISSTSSKSETSSNKINETSAWNSANTWEERDYTTQAKSKLLEAFAHSNNSSTNNISISKIEKVEGNASITHVRGRARFMYEWSFSLDFEATGPSSASGLVAVSDVINDQLDDIELEVKWKGASPSKDVAKVVKDNLKKEIIRRVKLFEESYRNI